MGGLSIILKESLPNLKKLYEFKKPLNVATTVAIGHFIKRFKKKPEWENKVNFYSLNDWKETGTFAMVNTNDNHIFINTLEQWPHESLRKTLELLNYDKPMVFICFRDIFRPIVLDVIRIRNMEITFDTGTKNMYQEYSDDTVNMNAPNGFYFDSLSQRNVEKINSVWMQRYSRSYEFLSNCIAQNPSTGLFNKKTDELVAWSITLEIGAAGNLQVDEKYRREGFGEVVTAVQMSKIRKELGYEINGHIAHYNKASFELSTKAGFKWIDSNSWIGVCPKPSPKLVPLWGI